ncbi:hypothetical protein LINPERPRIM_LOCUS17714 [Linum perenne]
MAESASSACLSSNSLADSLPSSASYASSGNSAFTPTTSTAPYLIPSLSALSFELSTSSTIPSPATSRPLSSISPISRCSPSLQISSPGEYLVDSRSPSASSTCRQTPCRGSYRRISHRIRSSSFSICPSTTSPVRFRSVLASSRGSTCGLIPTGCTVLCRPRLPTVSL